MIDFILENTQSMILVVALVTVLSIWAIKSTRKVSNKYLPLLALIVGGGIGFILGFHYNEVFNATVQGIIAGGFASGGYDTAQSFFMNKSQSDFTQEK